MILQSPRLLLLASLLFLALLFSAPTHINSADLDYSTFDTVRNTKQTAQEVDENELQCLTKAVYYEARGEPTHGKAAVAWVILNRVSFGFASTICEVVHQGHGTATCQFSYVCVQTLPAINKDLFELCRKIAYDVLVKKMYSNLVPKAVNFHSINIDPGWWNLTVVKQIGTHLFYKR